MKKLYLVHDGKTMETSSLYTKLIGIYDNLSEAQKSASDWAKYDTMYIAEIMNIMEFTNQVIGKSL